MSLLAILLMTVSVENPASVVRIRMRMHIIRGEKWDLPQNEFGSMALLMLRSSGFHGSPYAKELRVPWLSSC